MPARRPWDDPWRSYPASKPRATEGGIATRKQRGKMAETWWSNRLVELLASYGLGARMQRGRRYARQGQIVSFAVQPGQVLAQVQGSRRTPYMVSVGFRMPDEAGWQAVQARIEGSLQIPARLLAGEVPAELEAVFDAAGVPLLPRRWAELRATCSCPDWESPCKHVAAVLYVLADQLDDDPWLLLLWRGRTRAELLAHLGRGAAAPADIAPWWPLVPGAALPAGDAGSHSWSESGRADPLARLGPLAVEVRGQPVTELLAPAFGALGGGDG
ncbi:MAG TPA: SWIM zinc finger family protein [Ilumatobacter sp.]|nr:SWIM zinc finger family protein [Ilumatobacter sp.]